MHDIDRTQAEMEWGGNGAFEAEAFEFGGSGGYAGETIFNEADQMELASQLLEVTDEQELDQFLGDLLKKATQVVGKVLPSSLTNQLGGMLKGIAKKYLPVAGAALGNIIAPGVGGAVGGQAASQIGSLFGLELEGLSMEDQEFEVARQFVKLAGDAVNEAAQMPQTGSPPQTAQQALTAAAQQHAPGLLSQGARPNGTSGYQLYASAQNTGHPRRHSGRWYRRGNRIVLLGV